MATGTCMELAPTMTAQPAAPRGSIDPARRAGWLCLAASVASGVLLFACYYPLALGSLLGWVALAPLLVLVRSQARPRWNYFCAALGGNALFLPALSWMPVADNLMYAAWPLLACYCSLYFVAGIWLLRRLDRWHLPLMVTVPLVWAALEYVRCFLMTGFSWYLLAHTQHALLPIIQIADLGGVFLVSALVALVNAFLFECACRLPQVRHCFGLSESPPRSVLLQGGFLALLVGGAYGYGVYRLGQNQFQPGPTVCLLQSNLDQRLRNDIAREINGHAVETVTKHFATLCKVAALQQGASRPDLLIWPETSFPREWVEASPTLPLEKVPPQWRLAEADTRFALHDLAAQFTHIPHLIGMNSWVLDERGKHHFNSALLVNADGNVDGRFDKMHRVPFGEYVPLQDWLPFMKWFTPYDFDYSTQPGEKFTRFPLADNKYQFGVLICYEDTDPFLAREYARTTADGRAVDFLVNISNDGWFNGSAEHEEHLAVSRFRAIECRRAMVRAVNMGVSAVIDGNGRVLRPMPLLGMATPVWVVPSGDRAEELPASEWHAYKKLAGILKAAVPIDDRFSVYAYAGDWVPIGSWLLLIAGGGFALVRRRGLGA